MQTVLQDLRFALRQLRRAPGFGLAAILTLALGIGSAVAIFSVLDAVLLRPLPFANQARLVFPDTHAQAGYQQPWSYLSYKDARPQLTGFEALAGYSDLGRASLESPTGPVSLRTVKGTDNFFTVFGIKPILGRTYLAAEDQPGRDDVTVLSYEVWQRNFGGQRDVIGKVVRLDDSPYTVIGVMPSGFRFPLSAVDAIYTPLHGNPTWMNSRGTHWMRVVGLLKSGTTPEQAVANLRGVLANIARAYPDTDGGRTVTLIPLAAEVAGMAGGPLKAIAFAVLALLAIACINVAGLLLARGVKREREMALRSAVGAGRSRLIGQMVTESLVLSAAGLGLGVGFAYLLLAAMRVFLVESLARGADVHLSLAALAAAVVVSGLTSVLASLAPAVRLSGAAPNLALRSSTSTGTSPGQHRLRAVFVVTQVALSLVLVVISGLLLQHLRSLLNSKLGFEPEKILTVQLDLAPNRYANRDPLISFYQPLIERAAHLPGVQAVGAINILPIENWGSNSDVHIAGQPPYPPHQEMLAENRMVTSGYFAAMGTQLVRGRSLSPGIDGPDSPAARVVVNQAFQRKFFSNGGDPIGAHFDDNEKPELKTSIVGMTTDVRQDVNQPPLAESDFLVDELDPRDRLSYLASMNLVIRTDGDPTQLIAPLRAVVHDLDPTIPFRAPETMAQVLSHALVFERMESWIFGIFAGFALLLAVVGLYGLLQHEVELHTRDIGVRIALGSSRGRVVRGILVRVGGLLLVGLGGGWLLTFALRKVIASVIELSVAHDAALLLGLTLLLGTAGLAASLLPARRAASIDPMEALRNE